MSRNDSAWVSAQFAAGARDCTPASARHVACVVYAPLSRDPEASRRCGSVLSDAEQQRALRFVAEDDKAQFVQRRAFRRYCGALALGSRRPLSLIDFEATDSGRPCFPDLPGVWFSFSACRAGLLGAWSSTHPVGVDLEDRTENLEAVPVARRFFSAAEAKAVEEAGDAERLQTFVRLWCLKEAALKSVGEGLLAGLDALQFELAPRVRVVHAPAEHGGPARFAAHPLDGTGCCAALVVRSLY
jgi:4'-phosphopantetheinyl transferase